MKVRPLTKILLVLLLFSFLGNISQCSVSSDFDTEKEMLEAESLELEFKVLEVQKENVRLQKKINLLEQKKTLVPDKKVYKKTVQPSDTIPKKDSTKILSPEVSDTTKF
jgi:glycosylphosphatidylinositol transamidase (GPIT) subunit GPI8